MFKQDSILKHLVYSYSVNKIFYIIYDAKLDLKKCTQDLMLKKKKEFSL